MKTTRAEVEGYFNRIAKSYSRKYSRDDTFLYYFFNERLAEATRGVDLGDKRVLDIGAGTGNLYDHLRTLNSTCDYYAVDIAADMLENSNIPADRQFVGEVGRIELPHNEFDLMFLLGVTTYFGDERLEEMLDWMSNNLSCGGSAIITFTNRSSLDWKSRRIFRFFGKRLLPKRFVLAQDFVVFPRSVDQVRAIIGSRFDVVDLRWLNHTVFPLNQLFKGLSVMLARKIHEIGAGRRLMGAISSDFLLVLRKSDQ
ncbi:MAG TPA: methyltransferase domain-containing protein [Pyrinomonadaceae bacterium]|nr:class I SAM-dependent methyltransferase [Chloracidobacterium sp.]HBE81580.1 hypothetical protein [Blastocatellia bacterium]HRJ88824.1 methyltransferase domain-containing protein [Pyrinomonadaceae bacterium]HRK48903.1 methyltransferase domain-containing protein [Pyrinomonadaceae bacterium]